MVICYLYVLKFCVHVLMDPYMYCTKGENQVVPFQLRVQFVGLPQSGSLLDVER